MDEEVPPEHMNDLGYLGTEVREARQGRRLTQKHLGLATGYSESYISKVEAGAVLPSEKFMCGCDLAFGTNGLFLRLRERVTKRGHPSWFQPYVKLEEEAVSILNYSPSLISGMLQTGPYARAVFRAAFPREAEEAIGARAQARLRRREVLARPSPPLLWVILHEAALRTRVGDAGVMRDQLAHVAAAAATPHVTVQVLPFEAGAPPWAESFTLLEFADRSNVVYADTPIGGQLADSAEVVASAGAAYDQLRAEALPPGESAALIRRTMACYA